jgi:hypothetical protein
MTDIKQYFTLKKITEASAVMVMNPTNYCLINTNIILMSIAVVSVTKLSYRNMMNAYFSG